MKKYSTQLRDHAAKLIVILTLVLISGCPNTDRETMVLSSRVMEPTILQGSQVKIIRETDGQIRRFDIVIVKIPVLETKTVLRVVGLPGETLQVSPDGFYIDGNPIDYPDTIVYSGISEMPLFYGTEEPVEIPENRFYVVGDNMPIARDSRTFGLISEDRILGRIVEY